MKVLVCGGRDFNDPFFLANQIHKLIPGKIDLIIQGGARGADALAKGFAAIHNIPCLEFPADWDRWGKRAGPIRNVQMLDEGKPDLVIAFPGGSGTAHMVKVARLRGVKVIEIKKEK